MIDLITGLRPVSQEWLASNLTCRSACPVGTHAGGYASLVAHGLFEEAYQLARRPNPFASICGRICSRPCESACRRKDIDAPIGIRAIKRFLTEKCGVEKRSFEAIEQIVERPRPPVENGGRVAIVGAGPAGLSCAHDLALMGHESVLFDAAEVAGGMLRTGIPAHRLPRDLLQREIAFITDHLGVELRLGVAIGDDVEISELMADYDAVFLATGCKKSRALEIPGIECEGVLSAVEVLHALNLGRSVDAIGQSVVVVGAGNMAFDLARIARRIGFSEGSTEKKQVTLLALETRAEMPADREEIEEAEREGITIIERRAPRSVRHAEGRVSALSTSQVNSLFTDGRFAPEIGDEAETIPCDTLIPAIGRAPDLSFLGEEHGFAVRPEAERGGAERRRSVASASPFQYGTIAVEPKSLATSQPGVYAGGDLAFGPRVVIDAIRDGRHAAKSIDTFLTGRVDEPEEVTLRIFDTFGYDHPFAYGDYERLERSATTMLEVEERFAERVVEQGLTKEQAQLEGSRCLHCWINTIFDSRAMTGSECIQCAGCIDVCPIDCIDLVGSRRMSHCEESLPDGAPPEWINEGNGAVLIKDETACIRCGLCARRCPVDCITMQGFYRTDEIDLIALCERAL